MAMNRRSQDDLESGEDECYRSMCACAWSVLGSVVMFLILLLVVWSLMVSAASGIYVSGDVTCDMQVTQDDAEAILLYDVGLLPSPFCLQQCDVTMDGACNVVDAMFVLQRTAKDDGTWLR